MLLSHDFGVSWDVPEGQLLPTVTNRLNYIHWLQDLLTLSSPPGNVNPNGVGPNWGKEENGRNADFKLNTSLLHKVC